MAVTLNANSSTGFIATSDTSGVLQLQTGGTTALTIGTDQSVNFPVTGQRITGDFSNATVANRVAIQSSTVNGNTEVFAIPNGTGALAAFRLSNTSDITNNSGISMVATTTEARLAASNAGTGTYLPMTFFTGGSESLRLSATTKAVILAGGSTSANGTGITFPAAINASSDANTLDDYEEGAWTPSALTGTNLTGISWSVGSYTRVGRLVTLIGYANCTVTSSNTLTYLTMNGAPFTTGVATSGSAFLNNNVKSGTAQISSNIAYAFFPAASAPVAGAEIIQLSITYTAA
jgi:hypothetical protein